MDLLEVLMEEDLIKDFLYSYPAADWTKILKQTLVYGIHSFQGLQLAGLQPADQTAKPAEPRRDRTCLRVKRPVKKPSHKAESTRAARQPKRRMPRYLLNVDSKIRDQVHKDRTARLSERKLAEFKENTDPKVWSESPLEYSKQAESFLKPDVSHVKQQSSVSSMGSMKLPDALREFYQDQFMQLLPDHIPRQLRPVELTLESGPTVDFMNHSDESC